MLTVENLKVVEPLRPTAPAGAIAAPPFVSDVGVVAHSSSYAIGARSPGKSRCPVLPADRALAFGLPAWTAFWWQDHERELQAALDVAYAAAPHLREAALFLLPRLPCLVRASSTIKGEGDDDREFSSLLPLAEALRHRWISFNGPQWLNTISADVDHADWRSTLLDMVAKHGLPMPLMTVQSPWKGSAHIVWAFERPLWKKCPKQLRFRKGLSRGLVLAFGACPRFANGLQKNPWHRAVEKVAPDQDLPCGDPTGWEAYQAVGVATTYHTEVLGIGTVMGNDLLRPLLDIATERGVMLLGPKVRSVADGSRHIPLAPILDGAEEHPRGKRLFLCAARTVRRSCTGDLGRILRIVERTALALNSPADRGGIEGISSSIAAWMNSKWNGPLDGRPGTRLWTGGRDVDFGVMTGEAADKGGEALQAWRQLSKLQKRQAAAARSNEQRTAKKDTAIQAAVTAMQREGLKLTQKAVAQRSGVSHSTVHRRWHSLDLRTIGEEEDSSDSLISPWGTSPSFSSADVVTPSSTAKASNEVVKVRRTTERKAIKRYSAQATRLMCRGASMEVVNAVPAGVSEALRAAYQSAKHAERDLHRRIDARQSRERGKVTATARQDWHTKHRDDNKAWQTRLADLITSRERVAAQFADRPLVAGRMEMMFGAIIGAEWRARRLARGEQVPLLIRTRRRSINEGYPVPDMYDLLIPW